MENSIFKYAHASVFLFDFYYRWFLEAMFTTAFSKILVYPSLPVD